MKNKAGRLLWPVILAAGGLGFAPLAKKAALGAGASPLVLAVATVAVAATFILLYVVLRQDARSIFEQPPRTYFHLFLVGAMTSGAVVLLSILAMTETTATNRSLFQAMYPVATAIAARLMLHERLGATAYGIIVAMSLGLFLMNTGPEGLVLGRPFFLLAATLPLIGLADVYAKRTLDSTDPRFVTAGRFIAGTVLLSLFLPMAGSAEWLDLLGAWPWVLAAGCASACGVLGLYRAMDSAGASMAAAFIGLAPVITALAEWAILGAAFSGLQLSGLFLVVGGAAALARRV